MKPVLMLTSMIAIIAIAITACLIVFDVYSVERGMNFMTRALAGIGIIGLTSLLIAFIVGRNTGSQNEQADAPEVDLDAK
jgi:multisubunit Na+/H+ antiporter MnhB subunit